MKKIIASVAIAVVLGVAVMLAPIAVFTYGYHATLAETKRAYGQSGAESDNNATALVVTASSPVEGLEWTYRAAQTYGKVDAESASLPLTSVHVLLLVGVSFAAALGVSLYFRKRIETL